MMNMQSPVTGGNTAALQFTHYVIERLVATDMEELLLIQAKETLRSGWISHCIQIQATVESFAMVRLQVAEGKRAREGSSFSRETMTTTSRRILSLGAAMMRPIFPLHIAENFCHILLSPPSKGHKGISSPKMSSDNVERQSGENGRRGSSVSARWVERRISRYWALWYVCRECSKYGARRRITLYQRPTLVGIWHSAVAYELMYMNSHMKHRWGTCCNIRRDRWFKLAEFLIRKWDSYRMAEKMKTRSEWPLSDHWPKNTLHLSAKLFSFLLSRNSYYLILER